MKFVVCSVLALALSLPVQAQTRYEPRPGEKVDDEKGVAIRSATDVAPQGTTGRKALQNKATTCSLTFSPAAVNNGQTATYTVSYGGTGCVNGRIDEAVTLNWVSTVADFGELTVRKKRLFIPSGCLAASWEEVVAPSALGINGVVTAQLEVRDWTGSTLICTATGTLTVF